jgi:Proprotein convertase P-domain
MALSVTLLATLARNIRPNSYGRRYAGVRRTAKPLLEEEQMKAFLSRGCLALAGAFVLSIAGAGVASASSYSTGDIQRAIPDNGVVSIKIQVPDKGHVQSVRLGLRAKHTCPADMTIHLESPDGKSVTLFDGPLNGDGCGTGNDAFGSGNNSCSGNKGIFTDSASTSVANLTPPYVGKFQPNQPLEAFEGHQIQGSWHLFIVDDVNADSGRVGCVKLVLHHTSD